LRDFGEKIEMVTWECTYGHEFTKEECDIIFDNNKKIGKFLDILTRKTR